MDDTYLIDLLTRLVNIPSTFPREEAVMLFLEDELGRIGLPPERLPVEDGRFNLLARVGHGSPILCLNAHADTFLPSGASVPEARIKGDRMYGLGTADDKASIAAMICAVRAIGESGTQLKGTLDLLISVDEEGDAKGVRSAVAQGYRCDMAIVGEPTGLELVPCHCGTLFLDIVTHGKSTHGSIPMQGVNAIDLMIELVGGLRAVVTDCPPHSVLGPGTMNLGILRGGDRPNRVPDRCEASVDIRLVPPMRVEEMLARVEDYFAKWQGEAEFEVTKRGQPLDTRYDSPLVRTLADVGQAVTGKRPGIAGWRGWTEAESFQTGLGIDAVVYGPGYLSQAHSANEYVDLEQVRVAARVYAETAERIVISE